MNLNVLECGAVGDGVALDNMAINRALRQIDEVGGGVLRFPPGTYRCGTIELVSNVRIELEKGARIVGSSDFEDYFIDETVVNRRAFHRYLISGHQLENITITGGGCIDGNGPAFWEKEYLSEPTPQDDRTDYRVLRPKTKRPALIYLAGCKNIALDNIEIVDSAGYTVWLWDCEGALVRAVTVRNPLNGPNTDVLDIDCSENVTVEACDFAAGDDCIALKSEESRSVLPSRRPCRNVVVRNSHFVSATCAIRVGYEGDYPIEECLFENLKIEGSRTGINMLSIAPVCAFATIRHGTPIRNLRFRNITMRDVGQAFFIWAGNEPPQTEYKGEIDHITFENIQIDSCATSFIGSCKANSIRNLFFKDMTMRVGTNRLPPEEVFGAMPSHWGGVRHAGGMVLRNLGAVQFDQCDISCTQKDMSAVNWKEVRDFKIDGQKQTISGKKSS